MRDRIYRFVEPDLDCKSPYDYIMIFVIIVSLIPLAFKENCRAFDIIDKVTVTIFIVDYLLRLATADFKLRKGSLSFALYPLTPMAIIDLLSILPSFCGLAAGYRVLKLFRLARSFRVFRAFRLFRYSKSLSMIIRVIKKQTIPLVAVVTLALAYILISALVVFNVEPDTFNNFFDAIYWATVSLTTMGYGDIYPITTAGRIVTMLSSFVGIAIIALPAGIITAGYMDAVNEQKINK